MEVDDNIIALQSAFRELERFHGTLRLIKHIGGNEPIVHDVVTQFYEFLLNRESLNHSDILLVLLLNTEFTNTDDRLENKDFVHLINIIPKISKLIFIYIIVGTKDKCLVDTFCTMVSDRKLFRCSLELFDCSVDIINSLENPKQLDVIYTILQYLVTQMNDFNSVQDTLENDLKQSVDNIAGQLLMLLTVHPSMKTQEKGDTVHVHLGSVINDLLKLLLICKPNKSELENISNALMVTTSAVVKFVTVDVYCTWAEVSLKGEPLQYTLGVNAFKVVEKYTKEDSATELIGLLGCMAKKPKSVSELIQKANLETVVYKVNECDENQRRWFTVLLNFDKLFENQEALECVLKWSTLCTQEDVFLLLKLSMNTENINAKTVVLNCARKQSIEQLSVIIARLFSHYGKWMTFLKSDPLVLQKNFASLLNKLSTELSFDERKCQENKCEEIKEFQLLVLQDPQEVCRLLFTECMKKPFLTSKLRSAFAAIKNPLTIVLESSGILWEVVKKCHEDINEKSLSTLWSVLLESGCGNVENLIENVVKPLLAQYRGDLDVFGDVLKACKVLTLNCLPLDLKIFFVQLMLDVLDEHRIKYTEFSTVKLELCITAVDVLLLLDINALDLPEEMLKEDRDKMNSFYLTWTNANSPPSYLNHLFSDWQSTCSNYGLAVSKLIKVLPRCVPREWAWVTDDLVSSCGIEKCAQMITDCLILVSEVTNSTKCNTEKQQIIMALQYCLKNYGMSILRLNRMEISVVFECNLAKHICKLLTVIPQEVRRQEGLSLIPLLTDRALKNLAKDKMFVVNLTKINETVLSQAIASKMLSL